MQSERRIILPHEFDGLPPVGIRRRVVPFSSVAISARVKCMVVKNGRVVRELPWQRNLILNQFMERIYANSIVSNFTYAAASTGNTDTASDSGATVVAQSGTTATLSGGSFTLTPGTGAGTDSIDVGKIIKWDTGEMARIVAVPAAGSGLTATVTPSQTVGSDEFAVYQTTQTSLANTGNEERAGLGITGTSYLTGSGNCGVSYDGSGGVIYVRTYDFKIRANDDRVSTPYAEVGWTNSVTVGSATINSRVLLLTPVEVATGEQLRVKYEVTVTMSPTTSTVSSAIGGSPGWPTSGGVCQLLFPGLKTIDTSGVEGVYLGGGLSPMEPSENTTCFLSVDSTAFNAYLATPPNRSALTNASVATTKTTPGPTFVNYASYPQPNTLFHDKVAFFAASAGNNSAWRSIHWGDAITASNRQQFSLIMGANQVKDSLHSLQINLRYSYTRIIA